MGAWIIMSPMYGIGIQNVTHIWRADGIGNPFTHPHPHGLLEHVQDETSTLALVLHAVAHDNLSHHAPQVTAVQLR